jgi:2-phospho-L-lactate guanylyltransferase (CobY/MobA/RfbA family)
VDVVAVRLQELEEGEVLVVWVSLPLIDDEELEEIDEDEDDDDFYYG